MPSRRWLRLPTLVPLTALAYLLSSSAGELVGLSLLRAASVAGASRTRTSAAGPPPSATPAPRDGGAILGRNVFDSAVGSLLAPIDRPASDARLERCAAGLRLVSAVASSDPAASVVLIDSGGARDLYRVGARVDGGAELLGIGWRTAWLRPARGPACWIGLFSGGPSPSRSVAIARDRPRVASTPDPSLDAALDVGIRQLGDHSYEVDRALVDRVAASPRALGRARVQPVEREGEVVGYRVLGVGGASALSRLGLENGDVVRAVDDLVLTSPADALRALDSLRTARHVAVHLERRGQPIVLEVDLRDDG